jgi:hypothetical protein
VEQFPPSTESQSIVACEVAKETLRRQAAIDGGHGTHSADKASSNGSSAMLSPFAPMRRLNVDVLLIAYELQLV